MRPIQIDDEVFAILQKHAEPFVDSPNSTLRKLLKLDAPKPAPPVPPTTVEALLQSLDNATTVRRTKAPKADLRSLVQAGLLQNGDALHLVNYQGNRVGGYSAHISNGQLQYDNQNYTMSNLAQELLKKVGFSSDSVRGPAHWVTSDGVSIKDLWQRFTERERQPADLDRSI